ncbi:concanavalin A-like lectin/glucanase [Lentinus tigrinus ALCF2SS1-7]|uniref:Concanavalin A-like lectin/glucanase n=1 Tax=Lentinus tigrinus ALCF2SS1-6 TaxID=1328759 RepID=A0A5C2S5S0_9APHY|nr:concanavalin A-like lectin/glucanase [Lentinus tigrinus ALCF2SS1-6]RPD73463.1 concanavalin A-like lectin/glucanase [Lentinus tigrinus ALCF2SS1-7]
MAKTLCVDFSTFDPSNLTVAQFLAQNNLAIATYTVNKSVDACGRAFRKDNIDIQDGYLTMKVAGGTPPGGNVPSAGIRTMDKNILYGTFKTTAITSPIPGVCHGFFTYKNDRQEADIEILTASYETGLRLTNQNNHGIRSQNTHAIVPYPADPRTGEHEYTLEWTADATKFYFDGVLVATLNTNVPYEPSCFVWNSWSSGNKRWSAGPPAEDAILKISKIEIEYNTVIPQKS